MYLYSPRKLIEDAKYKDGLNCNGLDVKSLISFDQGVMTYKILHGLCPDNLRHKFVERSMVSEYNTRNRRDLQIPIVRLEQGRAINSYQGPHGSHELRQMATIFLLLRA